MLWVALHFPRLPPATLEPVAAWACQFTPKVSLEPPQALLAEVAGSLRRFGGPRRLLEKIRQGLGELGLEATVATAPTARAALWIARGGGRRLEDIPVEVVCTEDVLSFLKSIGVHQVGDLLQLPREGLAKRCGPALVAEIDRALGRLAEPRTFFEPPASFAARLELPAETVYAEALLFPARHLLAQLAGLLDARQEGTRGFDFILFHEKTVFSNVYIGLASPTRDKKRMADLLRERLGAMKLAQPVEAIAVEAGGFVPFAGQSRGMFGDAAADAEDWTQLLERLQARLGRAAVHGLSLYPDHRPEYAWRRVAPGDWEPREFRQPGPRPAWLLEPRRLGEGGFALLAGPERIESGWWDGDDAKRDYFVARLGESSLAWVYREAGEWYLHGLFA
ncbi:MAG TPA: DNA polymerase Y family protein [Burkholderiales bacterium]